MPKFSKGPYLNLRESQKGAGEGIWYIHDGNKRVSTGVGASDGDAARQALARYLNKEITDPDYDSRAPKAVSVAEVMVLYAKDKIPKQGRPEEAAQRMVKLVTFFGGMSVEQLTPSTTEAYVRWRCHRGEPDPKEPPRPVRPVKESTTRRELEDLKAAVTHSFKSRKVNALVPVTLSEKGTPREHWLTRSDCARLLLGTMGFTLYPSCDLRTRKQGWSIWKRSRQANNRALARFVLIGLYTGTRHDAILSLGLAKHDDGGFFDLPNNVLYRSAPGARRTKKRKPPAPIPRRLRAHLMRWERLDGGAHVYLIRSYLTGERPFDLNRSFTNAVTRTGLPAAVTPHILRHTCVTWRMQKGIPAWKVAAFVGLTVDLIERVYGHHSPNYLKDDLDDL